MFEVVELNPTHKASACIGQMWENLENWLPTELLSEGPKEAETLKLVRRCHLALNQKELRTNLALYMHWTQLYWGIGLHMLEV